METVTNRNENGNYRFTEPEFDTQLDDIELAANKLGLEYNFECIKFMLDTERISFGQLRCAQFFNGSEYYTDTNRAAYYLVRAGLIGSGQADKHNTDELDKKTYAILDSWRTEHGSLTILYIELIKQLEERHFFMDSAALMTAEKMSLDSSYKSYAELIKLTLAQEINEQLQLSKMQKSLAMHMTRTITTSLRA